jgi:hypothetical protein
VPELWTLGVIARTVKANRFIILGVLAALVIAYGISVIPNFRRKAELERTFAALQNLSHDRVETAVQAFVHDRKVGTTTLPATVTFDELVSGGYLHTNEVAAFGGKQVEVFLGVDGSTPAAIWIRVHLADNRNVVVNADGSIMLEPKL